MAMSKLQSTAKHSLRLLRYRFDNRDGFTHWQRTTGPRTGRRAVIIPGFGDTPLSWMLVVASLWRRGWFRRHRIDEVTLLEHPGHLGSIRGSTMFASADALIEATTATLDALSPTVLIGQSMGGYLAAHYAAHLGRRKRPPELLALLCPAGIAQRDSEAARSSHALAELMEGRPEQFVQKALGSSLSVPGLGLPARLIAQDMGNFLLRPDTLGFLRSWHARHDFRDRVHAIEPHTLLFWGEADDLVPVSFHQEWLSRLQRRTSKKPAIGSLLSDAGHGLHLEKPAEIARLLDELGGPALSS